MTDQERQAVLTLAIMAAFADGGADAAERSELKRAAESVNLGGDVDASAAFQNVEQKRVSLDDTVAALASPEARRLAYQLSVGVCHADGSLSDAERAFLFSLQEKLGFDPQAAAAAGTFTAHAEALAGAPLAAVTSEEPVTASGTMTAEEMDRVILNYAILNGALEILPNALATMAIIPLQMKMVYRIGKSYGFELDRGHIKDLLATAGAGMASQFVERIGAGLVGHLFGHGLLGRMLGGVASQVVSSGFAFASTYAMGKLAVRYYAGGRTFSTQMVKDTYNEFFSQAKGMQGQYAETIREKARTINVSQILQDVRA